MATCPRCRRHFRTLEDEEGMHDCPYCGYPPYEEEDEDLDAEEDHIRDRDAARGDDDEE